MRPRCLLRALCARHLTRSAARRRSAVVPYLIFVAEKRLGDLLEVLAASYKAM